MSSQCKRCLLRDLTDDDYFQNVYEYIAGLREDVKTPEEVYGRRLDLCRKCEHLVNGMCALCGCFVEVRAAKQQNYCAKDRSIW